MTVNDECSTKTGGLQTIFLVHGRRWDPFVPCVTWRNLIQLVKAHTRAITIIPAQILATRRGVVPRRDYVF